MRYVLLALLCTLIFYSCHKPNINGVYIGYEAMCTLDSNGQKHCYGDSSNLKKEWFYKSVIKIKDSVVFMDQSPVTIYKNDTMYSVSDGGFPCFKGTVSNKNDSISIILKQTTCDYCGEKFIINKDGTFTKAVITKKINGKYEDVI